MKKELPRICYILGGDETPLEIGEKFEVRSDYGTLYMRAHIEEDGTVYGGPDITMSGNYLCRLIQGKLKLIRRPHYTEQDIVIMHGRVAEGTPWVARSKYGDLYAYEERPKISEQGTWLSIKYCCEINSDLLLWIKPGECVDLRDIVGGG